MSEPVHTGARLRFKIAPNAPKLVLGLPVRKTSPVEFWISMLQALPPLNVRLSYLYQKGADANEWLVTEDVSAVKAALLEQQGDPSLHVCPYCQGSGVLKRVGTGKLPASARNAILERALAAGIEFCLFLDDDVLFPEMSIYRLWVQMQKHPEAACITGIYSTKHDPVEPVLYRDEMGGAFWDWALGDLVPIHSAGAGIMLVRMATVAKLEPPWFNDVVVETDASHDGYIQRNTWGHDRYFHIRLREEGGGVVYADTGLLCSHWDVDLQKNYILPPDAPCFDFRRFPMAGEAFVPYMDDGVVQWRRMVPLSTPKDAEFKSFLDWMGRPPSGRELASVVPTDVVVPEMIAAGGTALTP